jgi:hypothetical protein
MRPVGKGEGVVIESPACWVIVTGKPATEIVAVLAVIAPAATPRLAVADPEVTTLPDSVIQLGRPETAHVHDEAVWTAVVIVPPRRLEPSMTGS